jgi:uncharacterized repeat protein (TIGR03803 family)
MKREHCYLSVHFVVVASLLACGLGLPVQAQTFSVLHTFSGLLDGAHPAGLTIDRTGNFYGASEGGGSGSQGAIFKLANRNSSWTLTPLYYFHGSPDGAMPLGVVFGPDGRLYGTTLEGGDSEICGPGCGTVFRLRPPAAVCKAAPCLWTEVQLHAFTENVDGAYPWNADLAFDRNGNLYGTTVQGGGGGIDQGCGEFGCGTAYSLYIAGGSEAVLFAFVDGSSHGPSGGVILDSAGNLYGTASTGGSASQGTVFKLSPSGGLWTETVLHSFLGTSDGSSPGATLVSDSAGNLYGTTEAGGSGGGGTVFELSPSHGGWTFTTIYSFMGPAGGPTVPLTIDSAGNLYGATSRDGAHTQGNVFKLTLVNGSWSYFSLYDFTGGSDGGSPSSKVLIGTDGNLYGSTLYGGQAIGSCTIGCGVVYRITP